MNKCCEKHINKRGVSVFSLSDWICLRVRSSRGRSLALTLSPSGNTGPRSASTRARVQDCPPATRFPSIPPRAETCPSTRSTWTDATSRSRTPPTRYFIFTVTAYQCWCAIVDLWVLLIFSIIYLFILLFYLYFIFWKFLFFLLLFLVIVILFFFVYIVYNIYNFLLFSVLIL